MKVIFLLTLLASISLHAEEAKKEIPSQEDKGKISAAAKNASSETKKALRKIGRKSMDETCTLNESKAACEKQKAEHKALNAKEAVEGVPPN